MGRVESFKIAGLDLWFNSSDHLPPHFHARKAGHWEIRVHFLECTAGNLVFTMKWPRRTSGPDRRERQELLDAALAHRAELLREWEAKVIVKEDF